MKKLLVLSFVLFFTPIVDQTSASAQTVWMNDSTLSNYMLEKSSAMHSAQMHREPRAIRKHDENAVEGGFREINVYEDYKPEAEVYATSNPIDSMNLVISPIKLSLDTGVFCPIYYSKDFGHTWLTSSFVTIPDETPFRITGGGDPMFTWGADGKLYVAWIDNYELNGNSLVTYNKIYWASSNDGGATFTRLPNSYIASSTIGQRTSQAFDKEWLASDRTQSTYRSSIYAALVSIGQSNYIEVRRMIPDGISFNAAGTRVSQGTFRMLHFPNVAVDPNGGVHCTFFGSVDGNQYAIWHSHSTDGGATFSPEVKAVDVHFPRFSKDDKRYVPGIEQNRQYPCPNFTIDTSQSNRRGYLYLTWCANGTTSASSKILNIYFSRSTNNGDTWSEPQVVNDDVKAPMGDHFNPSIAVNGRGIISISWYDRRTDSSSFITNTYAATSFDGGVSFAQNQLVSGMPSDHRTFAGAQSFGVGDYASTIMTDNYTIPVWCDGRMGGGDVNVYAAWVPINGVPVGAVRMSSPTSNATLEDIYPNPLTASTNIRYTLSERAYISMSLTDVGGRRVATIAEKVMNAGEHQEEFDASKLPSGVYYCELRTSSGFSRRAISVVR